MTLAVLRDLRRRVAGPTKPPPLGGVTGVLVWEAAKVRVHPSKVAVLETT